MGEDKATELWNHYTKFVLMLAASFVAMYLTMYLKLLQIDHVILVLTRSNNERV